MGTGGRRPLVRRGPAPDEDWEYHRCRQADPDALAATIGIGGERLDLSELRFTVAHVS